MTHAAWLVSLAGLEIGMEIIAIAAHHPRAAEVQGPDPESSEWIF
jgi:hypothetical protein